MQNIHYIAHSSSRLRMILNGHMSSIVTRAMNACSHKRLVFASSPGTNISILAQVVQNVVAPQAGLQGLLLPSLHLAVVTVKHDPELKIS